jgi:uncharacterized protein YuzE
LSTSIEFQLDCDVNALYIKLRSGRVAATITLSDSIYADVDEAGAPIGLEFVNADEFVPFLRRHADDADLPPEIRRLFRVTSA